MGKKRAWTAEGTTFAAYGDSAEDTVKALLKEIRAKYSSPSSITLYAGFSAEDGEPGFIGVGTASA